MSEGYTFRSLLELHLAGSSEIEAVSIQRTGQYQRRSITVLFRDGLVLEADDMNHEPNAYVYPRYAAERWADSIGRAVRQDFRTAPIPPRPMSFAGDEGEWFGAFQQAVSERAS